MPQVTTAEIFERFKAAADLHDDFVTPRQGMYWASQERMALDLFIATKGWAQAFETLTLTVTGTEAGSFIIDPPDAIGVMAVVAVFQIDGEQSRRLEYQDAASWMYRSRTTAVGNAAYYRCKHYKDTVQLDMTPSPTSGETYVVVYLPHPTRLTLDAVPAEGYTNVVHYPMGWEERIVLGMAARALDKEESDSGAIQRQIRKLEADIEQLCADRVMGEGLTVINSDIDKRGWGRGIVYPSPASWWWA